MARGRWRVNVNFTQAAAETDAKLPAAVLQGARYLHSVVTPLVPVETGNLVGAGDVGPGAAPGDTISNPDRTAHLYYPGPYALYQHEGVYFRRPAHYGAPLTHEHGESFFLERPTAQHAEEILAVIQDALFADGTVNVTGGVED